MVPLMRKYITRVAKRYMPAGITLVLGMACLCFPVPSLTPKQFLVSHTFGLQGQ
jgi:hypothetical protein